jgi:hypothetical protein
MRNLIHQGVSFAITIPPLMNIVWGILQNTWNPIIEKIFLTNPDVDFQGMAKLVTMEVVLAQIRSLRPIFLITVGCMCFVWF